MKRLSAFFLILIMLFSTSCRQKYLETAFFSMDTYVTIKVADEGCETEEITGLVKKIEKAVSRTDPDSDIYRFNHSQYGTEASQITIDILNAGLDAAKVSDGLFDPTIEPLVSLWNIAHGEPKLPSDDEIETALKAVGYGGITVEGNKIKKENPAVSIDLGGIGKGYACQAVIDLLKKRGVSHGLISFGGNIGVFGLKPDGTDWTIGVRDPDNADDVVGYLHINEGFVSVSGDYERYFEIDGVRYHHILDPRTGRPASNGMRSVAVISQDGTQADALSTMLFVMGYKKAMEFYNSGVYNFEAVFITADGVFITDGLTDIFKYK
jgi:thiamine biosynthesis lipoprotein